MKDITYIFQDFNNKKSFLKNAILVVIDRGCSAVVIYRISSWFWMRKLTPLAVLFKQLNILINSCDIAYQAKIGKGFKIYHALGIVITKCEIGENFSIYQNVTIGNNIVNGKNRTAPIIGSNVSFLVGSVVVGPILIGNNVKVAPNAVVIEDIPSGFTAVGVLARLIDKSIEKK